LANNRKLGPLALHLGPAPCPRTLKWGSCLHVIILTSNSNLMKKEPSQNEDSSSWTQPNSCIIFIIIIIIQCYSWIRTISPNVQTMTKRCNFSSFSPLFFITLFFYSSLFCFWIKASWNHRGSSQSTPWVFDDVNNMDCDQILSWIPLKSSTNVLHILQVHILYHS
jgi:hypothetical protein